MTAKPIKVPFNERGEFLDYVWVGNGEPYKGVVWKDNEVFFATMTIDRISRGRSAANFHLLDGAGHSYNMFMVDTLDMLKRARSIEEGVVTGRWTFVKRGRNYGVKLVD